MPRNDHGVSTLTITILVVSLILAGVAAMLIMHQHDVATRPASVVASRQPLSAEQKAYLSSLTFGEFHMSQAANFLNDTVTYLDGSVTNQGTKPLRTLDVQLEFVDSLNQVVLRDTVRPLAGRATPLPPGETYAFRVTFEHLPVDWNQAAPTARAVYLEF